MIKLIIFSDINHVESDIDLFFVNYKVPTQLRVRMHHSIIEGINNAIIHGNKYDTSKKVILTLDNVDGMFLITIEDEGEGFDYEAVPDPTDISNLNCETGRGLYLMKHMADKVSFAKKGAKVILSFKDNS